MSQTKADLLKAKQDLEEELELTQRKLSKSQRDLEKQTGVADACTRAMAELHRAADALMIQTVMQAGTAEDGGYTLRLPQPDAATLLADWTVHARRQDGGYIITVVPAKKEAEHEP